MAVFIAMTVFIGIAMRSSLGPGKIGLSILYAMQLASIFQWTVRQVSQLLANSTCVMLCIRCNV